MKVTHIRTQEVRGHDHISAVKLETGKVFDAAELMSAIESGERYTMVIPKGKPHAGREVDLVIATCNDCTDRVLSAPTPPNEHRGGY